MSDAIRSVVDQVREGLELAPPVTIAILVAAGICLLFRRVWLGLKGCWLQSLNRRAAHRARR